MQADDYQQWTASIYESGQELWYYALGLAGESGETVDAIKKGYRHYSDSPPLNVEKVLLELGDTLWYAARIASHLGYSLTKVMDMNREKLEMRARERNING